MKIKFSRDPYENPEKFELESSGGMRYLIADSDQGITIQCLDPTDTIVSRHDFSMEPIKDAYVVSLFQQLELFQVE